MTAARQADATLRGFHYQMLLTLVEILGATEGQMVTVEGIIEDIDVADGFRTNAIQCKYLESAKSFSGSLIYKPVLQMVNHFIRNVHSDILYRLYIHVPFPPESFWPDQNFIQSMLSSKNKELQNLICEIPMDFDAGEFLARLSIKFTPSLKEQEALVKRNLSALELDVDSVEELLYPNAITYVGELSRKYTPEERVTSRKSLIDYLKSKETVLYSKWSIAIRGTERVLRGMKKQLSASLDINSRHRYFILGETVPAIKAEWVDIITSFVGKYASKAMLHSGELIFFIDTQEQQTYESLLEKLQNKGSKFHQCELGTRFNMGRAMETPKVFKIGKQDERTFFYKIARLSEDSIRLLEDGRCHDLFIASSGYIPPLGLDAQVYELQVNTPLELKYVLGVRDSYE